MRQFCIVLVVLASVHLLNAVPAEELNAVESSLDNELQLKDLLDADVGASEHENEGARQTRQFFGGGPFGGGFGGGPFGGFGGGRRFGGGFGGGRRFGGGFGGPFGGGGFGGRPFGGGGFGGRRFIRRRGGFFG